MHDPVQCDMYVYIYTHDYTCIYCGDLFGYNEALLLSCKLTVDLSTQLIIGMFPHIPRESCA